MEVKLLIYNVFYIINLIISFSLHVSESQCKTSSISQIIMISKFSTFGINEMILYS